MVLEKSGDDAGVEGSDTWVYVSDSVAISCGM